MNNEITGPIIGCSAYLFCALCFIGLGIYAINSKKPMNFWAGDKIPPEKINDLKKYNRANGIMWIIYGLLWLPGCVITFFQRFTCRNDLWWFMYNWITSFNLYLYWHN